MNVVRSSTQLCEQNTHTATGDNLFENEKNQLPCIYKFPCWAFSKTNWPLARRAFAGIKNRIVYWQQFYSGHRVWYLYCEICNIFTKWSYVRMINNKIYVPIHVIVAMKKVGMRSVALSWSGMEGRSVQIALRF